MWVFPSVLYCFLPVFGEIKIYRGRQKSKPDNFCNNFVYCLSIFIIFSTVYHRYTIENLQLENV